MCERNTTDGRDLLSCGSDKLNAWWRERERPDAALLEFRNLIVRRMHEVHADSLDALRAQLAARPDERAVREREREREALSKLAEVAQRKGFRASEVCKNDHRDLADAGDILAFRDREYPALPLPIPPCPLSGGREVRYVDGTISYSTTGGTVWWAVSREGVFNLARTTDDARTLADWLDSLPENNA